MKKISKSKEKFYDNLGKEDEEKWDAREYGNDKTHTKAAPEFAKTGTIVTTFRLPVTMVAELKKNS